MGSSLRLLDPAEDIELYREAYDWRIPKKHLFGPRISFEDFTNTEAPQVTFGLFNGELVAVYFFRETQPTYFESHFTSKKGTSRDVLLQGAIAATDLCLTHGATELYGVILAENRPLRQFVTDVGMKCVSRVIFTCIEDLESVNFSSRNQRTFLKYAKRV